MSHATPRAALASLGPPHIRVPTAPRGAVQNASLKPPIQADGRLRHHSVSLHNYGRVEYGSHSVTISRAILLLQFVERLSANVIRLGNRTRQTSESTSIHVGKRAPADKLKPMAME